jgi:hypothetical protein
MVHYLLTSFECILRESIFIKFEALGNPAVGDTRWLWEAAAAMGTENRGRPRGEDALRKIEANTLAAYARFARGCGFDGGGLRMWVVGMEESGVERSKFSGAEGALKRDQVMQKVSKAVLVIVQQIAITERVWLRRFRDGDGGATE